METISKPSKHENKNRFAFLICAEVGRIQVLPTGLSQQFLVGWMMCKGDLKDGCQKLSQNCRNKERGFVLPARQVTKSAIKSQSEPSVVLRC
jgi:hypothetical protein